MINLDLNSPITAALNTATVKSHNSIAGDLSGTAKAETLEQAALQFEALFLRSMMQQMRKAADAMAAKDDLFNSKQQRMMRDFYDDTLVSTLVSQGRVGIADLLVKQLGS